MSIADSAPLQILAEGFVTIPGGPGTGLVFEGHGIESVARGTTAQGSFDLVLDRGLIGNAGAVEAVPQLPLITPPDPNVRTIVTLLGIAPPGTFTIAVSYFASFLPGVGARIVSVVTTDISLVPTDPAGGFSFIVLRGFGGGPVP